MREGAFRVGFSALEFFASTQGIDRDESRVGEGRLGEISRDLCYEDILQFNMAAQTQTVKFSDIYDLKEELGK